MMKEEPGHDRSDEDLALLAAVSPESMEGRQAACLVLGRWARTIYRWCYRYVGDPDLAEDLAQDALLRAYTHLGEFEGWGRFSAWIFAISRNVCLDGLRRRSRGREVGLAESLVDPRPGPDAALEADQAEEELLQLIQGHLSSQEQEALWLRCVERMSVGAITRSLGITQASGARGVIQNARRKLRAALGERCPSLPEGDDD